VFLLAAATSVFAQPRLSPTEPGYLHLGPADQTEGGKVLTDFRQHGWGQGGAYFLEFELHVLPRRGDERVVPGRLWGGRNETGLITRIELQPGVKDVERRLLVQAGAQSSVWSWPAAAGTVTPVGRVDVFEPLAGTDLTAFDLQMPFLDWPDFVYEGVEPLRGRPTHVFLMGPPVGSDDGWLKKGLIRNVRIWLDTQFNALVQAEELDRDQQPLKAITVLDLKKVGEQWIVKAVDVRNETTRDKTQFLVTGAALDQKFPAGVFDPAHLGEPAAAPPPDQVQKIDQ
jgi:hypothetical protein